MTKRKSTEEQLKAAFYKVRKERGPLKVNNTEADRPGHEPSVRAVLDEGVMLAGVIKQVLSTSFMAETECDVLGDKIHQDR